MSSAAPSTSSCVVAASLALPLVPSLLVPLLVLPLSSPPPLSLTLAVRKIERRLYRRIAFFRPGRTDESARSWRAKAWQFKHLQRRAERATDADGGGCGARNG
jgi:hypothetical protein